MKSVILCADSKRSCNRAVCLDLKLRYLSPMFGIWYTRKRKEGILAKQPAEVKGELISHLFWSCISEQRGAYNRRGLSLFGEVSRAIVGRKMMELYRLGRVMRAGFGEMKAI